VAAPAYLISAAGIPNFGDEFILRAWLRHLRMNQPERDVWVDCPEPGRASILMRHVHPRARFVNTLWHLSRRVPSDDPVAQRAGVAAAIDGLGTPELDSGLLVLRSAGSVHLVVGGYLTALWAENLALIAAGAHLARRHGIPTYMTGAGLMPSPEGHLAAIREDLSSFEVAESRDAGGAALFGIPQGPDDAVLDWRSALSAESAGAPDIMILIQGDLAAADLDEDAELALVDAFVARARAAGKVSLGFIEGFPQHDGRRWSRYRERYPDAAFLPFEFVWETGFPARPGQAWLTSRFHFHLLAAAHGAAGVAVIVEPSYYGPKHSMLEEWGTGWPVRALADSIDDLPEPDRNEGFRESLIKAETGKRALADRIYPPRIPLVVRLRRRIGSLRRLR